MRPASLQVETAHIEETFHLLMEDIKNGVLKYSQEYEKLTSEIMSQITVNIQMNLDDSVKLQNVTPEMVADSVMSYLTPLALDEAKQEEIRETMITLCTAPCRLTEKINKEQKLPEEY